MKLVCVGRLHPLLQAETRSILTERYGRTSSQGSSEQEGAEKWAELWQLEPVNTLQP